MHAPRRCTLWCDPRSIVGRCICPVILSSRTPMMSTVVRVPTPLGIQDINKNSVHVLPGGELAPNSALRTIHLDEPVGTVVPTTDPDIILVATQRDVLEVRVSTGEAVCTLASTPEEHGTGACERVCVSRVHVHACMRDGGNQEGDACREGDASVLHPM
jgi:hypothetical protein